MIDKAALINTIASKAADLFNGDKSQTREDIEKNIKALVDSALSKLELVTRDEFDTQVAVLRHTRERLEALEKAVEALRSEQTLLQDSSNNDDQQNADN
ncbi:accessory factor UbiK family protein [Endozoicomonas sp. SCSIO W0465]|uniref:accessory factor UbiK family protein n=1 Tax=Endozoicomonas sp. SCSIO W0465 TaxID=2918516 RepID=UPI0020759C87|nr:accessory factor UbiK family protein [Endozoicomonas sp. SCSIO W0465]USE38119.1 accessory factor UbiK family protein [Endozoicomonas sp. SCSIO W0465]